MPKDDREEAAAPRKLSRNETHDLSMIIKDRVKVLKAHVRAEAARHLADFERHLASVYQFDDDDHWKELATSAARVVADAQEKIERRAKQLGIPARFAPRLDLSWHGRGENALAYRRQELKRVAETAIAAMTAAAETKIEKQSLDLRTQVVAMGVLSPDAKLFLESLASVSEAMTALQFKDIEARLEPNNSAVKRLRDY